jgi:DNA-binding LacI/PurR family transcriptional regulator
VRRASAKRGIELETLEGSYTGPAAGEHTGRLLGHDPGHRPTAIIYGSDVMAASGLSAAFERGVQVPAELSVLSWDDSQLATLMRPSITALRRDNIAYGALAADCLMDLIAGINRGRLQVAPSTLVARDSSTRARV